MDTGWSVFFSSLRQVNNRLFNHSVHLSSCSVENPLYGADIRLPAEAGTDDVGYLVEVERRVLGLEVYDEPADVGRELLPLGRLRFEEALHTLLAEACYPALEGASRDSCLLGTFGNGGAEQHRLTYPLVLDLLGPPAQRQYLLEVVGGLYPRALSGHALPPRSQAAQAVLTLPGLLPGFPKRILTQASTATIFLRFRRMPRMGFRDNAVTVMCLRLRESVCTLGPNMEI